MATINYTAEHNVARGYVKVEWTGLSNADVGQAFDCGGLKIGSVHSWGGFSGNLSLEASNELTPANFKEITNFGSGEAVKHYRNNDEASFVGAIRPSFPGSGTANMAILFVKA